MGRSIDPREERVKLEQARACALKLPGTVEAPHHNYGSFRVNGKIYATVPPGGEHLNIFVDELEREQALALYPQAFEKLFWGASAVGLRTLLPEAERGVVERLLESAWSRKASKAPIKRAP